MAIKTAASTLILSALALVGDYSAAPASIAHPAPIERAAKQHRISDLKRELAAICRGWEELDSVYAQAIQVTLKREVFAADKFEQLPGLISQTRGLEAALKAATVPAELAAEHMALRRAVAKTRGRLVTLKGLFAQTVETPSYVESSIDMNGLKALADHSTRRLAELA
ncbi:hypothetical protein D3C78_1120780 [compost metagenome]